MTRLRDLWADEQILIVSTESVLVATLSAIGMSFGLTAPHNQVVQKKADLGSPSV